MILGKNKIGIIDNKILNRVYWKEMNIRYSNNNILYSQPIWVYELITSNNLIRVILNEINRQ